MRTDRIFTMAFFLAAMLVAGCGKTDDPSSSLSKQVQQCRDGGGEVCHDKCQGPDCYLFCKPPKGRIDYTKIIGECKIGRCPNPCG